MPRHIYNRKRDGHFDYDLAHLTDLIQLPKGPISKDSVAPPVPAPRSPTPSTATPIIGIDPDQVQQWFPTFPDLEFDPAEEGSLIMDSDVCSRGVLACAACGLTAKKRKC